MTTNDAGPRPTGPYGRIFDRIRIATAQPACDAVHAATGVTWHRLALFILRTGIVFDAAAMVAAGCDGQFSLTGKDPTIAVIAWLGLVWDAVMFTMATVRQARFSRTASKDPFIAFDPFYRSRETGEMAAFYWVGGTISTLCLEAPADVTTILLWVTSGARSLADAASAGLHLGAYLALVAGFMIGGCERSRRGRRGRADRRETSGKRAVAT